ncbi:MAG: VWA domain-containing protein [Acidobacteriota bacterium]
MAYVSIAMAGMVLSGIALSGAALADDGAEDVESSAPAALSERYATWLENVDLLITEAEREVFLAIKEDYQRDSFIRRFWKVRDPFTRTGRNELQEAWEARAARARQLFENVTSARAQMMLTFGEPSRRNRFTCSDVIRPLEVWEYVEGSDRIVGYFTLVFMGFEKHDRGLRSLWEPTQGLSKLITALRSSGGSERQLAQQIARECTRGDEILSALAQTLDISRLRENSQLLPKPSDEWVRTFAARSTDVPGDAEPLQAELHLDFPGRNQSRTVVQGVVGVPKSEVEASQLGDYRSYNLLIDGEILRKGELFDHFRYRFDFPEPAVKDHIPLVVQRYLRPGPYELILKVEDLNSKRVFREARQLDVPRVEQAMPAAGASASGVTSAAAQLAPLPHTDLKPRPPDPATLFGSRLDEANATIATGDHTIKILSLPNELTVGQLRVRADARGEGISRVAFELNGKSVMRKSRPPYSVEIQLGDRPRTHSLRALALDDDGKVLASDEVIINAGPHRFAIRLLEPQAGKTYLDSVRAHAEVEVPEGEQLDKVELFLNENLLATLYQPPYEQPILLDGAGELTYVRAVAHLRDGTSAEDVQIINAPDYIDSLKVQFVELYTTVVDRGGEFVEDLKPQDFTVFEEDTEQEIRRFETMRDLPIRAGLVLDTSTSMMTSLSDVKKAAHRFFESVLSERDRAALITFSDAPQLVVRFTNSQEVLAGGLAGLVAEGETALFDSIIFSLHYFSGLQGKRAIVVLTDGEDSNSAYSYEDAIDFARRTGVAIYIVGLRLQSQKNEVRMRVQRLARETGGECFFIDRASQLGEVYDSIQQELRSQYLIAYQSSKEGGEEFREVEIKMDRKGLEAKTIRGYYP